ncbi:MAG: NAD(P)H-hydrate dehydratase [Gammaproteobacteria bacterium]|nr:NAD(P)H-hydrate dehydratase [Gammaproteobacteria bacterium]
MHLPAGSLPAALYDASAARALDAAAIDLAGIPALELMRRAGAVVWRALSDHWPRAGNIAVVCGGGNNAGDGYVIARLAAVAGKGVQLIQIGDTSRLGPAARLCRSELPANIPVSSEASVAQLARADVIVDALFGVGLDRPASGIYASAIEAINAAHRPVLAVDVPSGLNASTGAAPGAAVKADLTVTFIGCKQGLLTGVGPDLAGEIRFEDLGVPESVAATVPATASRIDERQARRLLSPRTRTAHKGAYGHVLVVGGAPGFAGAALLAAEAAARVGAGLITVATHLNHAAQVVAVRPELMCHGVAMPGELSSLIARASVVAIGPGLGQEAWGRGLFATILETKLPLVIDADALNLLAVDPVARGNWILTPHPGEAARLLRCDTNAVQQDRFAAVRRLQQQYGGVCVLKGAGTLLAAAADASVQLCTAGNPGMASGGMGDVLTGVIAGLLAQGASLPEAAASGVWLHANAADRAAAGGERGLLARDLMPHLRTLVNPGASGATRDSSDE